MKKEHLMSAGLVAVSSTTPTSLRMFSFSSIYHRFHAYRRIASVATACLGAVLFSATESRADVVSEAEALTRTSSGATTSVTSDSTASGGAWVALNSTAAGQSVDFSFPSIPAGSYQVKLKYKTNTTRGQLALSVDGAAVGNVDQYAATVSYPEVAVGTVTLAASGAHTVRLAVTGKNSASTGFILNADRITFVTQSTGGTDAKLSIPGSAVTASTNDGNVPANVVDGDLATRWSASGDPQWIQFDLGGAKKVSFVKIAFYSGAARSSRFDILTSSDGTNFTAARTGISSSGTSTALETFDFPDVDGVTQVRIVGHGNTVNAWNSYTEVEIWGGGSTGPGQVAAPTITPNGGSFSSPQSVTLASSTPGASIHYTLDGSTPTPTTGTAYTGPVTVSASATLKAIAFASGLTNSTVSSATFTIGGSTNYTPAQVLAGVKSHMTSTVQVNTLPHINTMTRAKNVNVYQVSSGVFAYTSSMAIDTDGSDPDPDPDHQGQTTWQDDNGKSLGAHHVPFYVLGDGCFDQKKPCPHFYYAEHNITGLQFALIFYNGKCIGAVFGDTQGDSVTPTSDNDSRELGEASVESAVLLGIPSSGTTGGVDDGVTVVIFSGSQWVVHGTNSTLNSNAQALVQKALNQLGSSMGL
jgi:hypothetical protein